MARVRICGEEEVAERRAGRSDERLGRVGRLGVEDVEAQEDGGIVRGEGVGREREDEALVPGGFAPADVVGAGGGAAGGFEVGDDVGTEVTASPVDVLQVLPGYDCNLQVERLGRRHWRRQRRHRRRWGLELGVGSGRKRVLVLVRVRVEGRGGRRGSHGAAAEQRWSGLEFVGARGFWHLFSWGPGTGYLTICHF